MVIRWLLDSIRQNIFCRLNSTGCVRTVLVRLNRGIEPWYEILYCQQGRMWQVSCGSLSQSTGLYMINFISIKKLKMPHLGWCLSNGYSRLMIPNIKLISAFMIHRCAVIGGKNSNMFRLPSKCIHGELRTLKISKIKCIFPVHNETPLLILQLYRCCYADF